MKDLPMPAEKQPKPKSPLVLSQNAPPTEKDDDDNTINIEDSDDNAEGQQDSRQRDTYCAISTPCMRWDVGPFSGESWTHTVLKPKLGAATLTEALTFKPMIEQLMKEDPNSIDALVQNWNGMFLGSTQYSGADTPVLALDQVGVDLRRAGLPIEEASGPLWLNSCDIDKGAQAVLLAMSNLTQQAPPCVLTDMLNRIPKELVKEIQSVPCPPKDAGQEEHDNALAAKRSIIEANMDLIFPDDLTNECIRCGKQCPLYSKAIGMSSSALGQKVRQAYQVHRRVHGDATAMMELRIAGTTCVAFSSYGKREKLSHASVVPYLVWEGEICARQPAIWVHECGPDFAAQTLADSLSPLYLIFSLVLCPTRIACPSRRQRRWSFGIHRATLVFTGCLEHYLDLVTRELQMDGQVYFIQNEHEVQCYLKDGCEKQGVFQNPDVAVDEMTRLRWEESLDPSSLQRLACHKDRWQHRVIAENMGFKHTQHVKAEQSWVADHSQNPEMRYRASTICPTLMTSSKMWSMQKGRGMMPLESMLAQGFLVLEDCVGIV